MNGQKALPSSGFRTRSQEEITVDKNAKGNIGSGFITSQIVKQQGRDRNEISSGFSLVNDDGSLISSGFQINHSGTSGLSQPGEGSELEGLKTCIIEARYLTLGLIFDGWKMSTGCMPFNWDGEVAEVVDNRALEIHGSIKAGELAPKTTYGAYLVYYLPDNNNTKGFALTDPPLEVVVKTRGHKSRRNVSLDPQSQDSPQPRLREDGWMEIEMGEFLNGNKENAKVETSVKQKDSKPMSGLFIQGIEFRPKAIST
ncbi:hypothetical protein GIB67_029158 [Kingdonia uniflora]|uniref:Uncharacterized protein n=1 Tax=Kingdonia uniflora TaxID=39325 RepID=A0A7J7MES5_9MAGN|nr:hypothetical protein GIB67_029158 [Kingdonia uniflora]